MNFISNFQKLVNNDSHNQTLGRLEDYGIPDQEGQGGGIRRPPTLYIL
jgi:hypothetical protein